MLKLLNKIGWGISAGVALTLSAYSLFYVARAWGMPPVLAGAVSLVFDGAAIVVADMSLRAVMRNRSGAVDRFLTGLFAGVSAWLNSYHARLIHAGGAAWLLYAAPPVVAVVLFDRHTRNERAAKSKKSGRVDSPLPRIHAWAWGMYPLKSWHTMRAMILFQLTELQPEQTGSVKKVERQGKASLVRAWAQMKGLEVSATGKIADPIWAAWEEEERNRHERAS